MVKYRQKNSFQPVGDLIKRVAGDLMNHPNSKAQRLWRYWRLAVGDHVARYTEPVRLENGVLHVRVDNSVWMHNLSLLKPEIVQNLQKSYPEGAVKDLRLRQGSLRSKPVQEPKKAEPPLPPTIAEEKKKAAKIVDKVSDPDLKALLAKLYESHLVRKRIDPSYFE
ncbi:MAG: DUF721 domain-containing protein [Magnetococcales bacterium]|nr:DUF721 domain-containing protein [Magnetococcales bacterium]